MKEVKEGSRRDEVGDFIGKSQTTITGPHTHTHTKKNYRKGITYIDIYVNK